MVESNELVERWNNVERVLSAMPEHERQHHWDMGTWGEVNDCGTIACAAGHCGLDPWFRDRGFTLNFRDGDAHISSVEGFFGLVGSQRIFLDTKKRPVETVIQEVHEYVNELRKLDAIVSAPGIPKIGEEWPDQGGIFSGAILGIDGAPDRFLIVGPEHEGYCTWDQGMAWVKDITVGDLRDYVLPDRPEQMVLFDRVKPLFKPTAYWSRTQHASTSDCAWGQYFYDGGQGDWYKSSKLHSRAVRSILIP